MTAYVWNERSVSKTEFNQLMRKKGKDRYGGSERMLKVALVISGLGSNRPNGIIAQLEEMGYHVQYARYYTRGLPPAENLDLVVGHSAGGTRAQIEYGDTSVRVVSLNAPTRSSAENVTNVQNALDVVSLGSLLIHQEADFVGGAGSHDKNESFAYYLEEKHEEDNQ